MNRRNFIQRAVRAGVVLSAAPLVTELTTYPVVGEGYQFFSISLVSQPDPTSYLLGYNGCNWFEEHERACQKENPYYPPPADKIAKLMEKT